MSNKHLPLVLASSSPFRREIDARLAELADEPPIMPKSMIHPEGR